MIFQENPWMIGRDPEVIMCRLLSGISSETIRTVRDYTNPVAADNRLRRTG
jgi:hypothetical protein